MGFRRILENWVFEHGALEEFRYWQSWAQKYTVRVTGGKTGEEFVDRFVSEIGKEVTKLLIMDREFINEMLISRFKKTRGIGEMG